MAELTERSDPLFSSFDNLNSSIDEYRERTCESFHVQSASFPAICSPSMTQRALFGYRIAACT